jgi:hypothetical protein
LKVFNTLTEFFCWLSVTPAEGARYVGMAYAAAYPPQGQEAAKIQALREYLAARLRQQHIDIILSAIRGNSYGPIRSALQAEQLGPVDAYFRGAAVIWGSD